MNQLDIYNDIVANGINPDSSSWDLRKTFELMKDPREKSLRTFSRPEVNNLLTISLLSLRTMKKTKSGK